MSFNNDVSPAFYPGRLARDFSRIGKVGLWLQIVLLVIPLALVVYLLLFRRIAPERTLTIDVANYLSIGGLIVLVFTTFWFYRYTRLAREISNPGGPTIDAITNIVWIGIWAGCIGIGFSILRLLNTAGRMLITLLSLPPGIVMTPTRAAGSGYFVTPADAIGLLWTITALTGELIVLGLSIWLLFRTTRRNHSNRTNVSMQPIYAGAKPM